jgi:hypothetical protein
MGVELGRSLSGRRGNLLKGWGLFTGNGSIFQAVPLIYKMAASLFYQVLSQHYSPEMETTKSNQTGKLEFSERKCQPKIQQGEIL